MFEKPRCRCPRCAAGRRARYLVAFGVCVVIALGYLMTVGDQRETVPDLSLEGFAGPAAEPSPDGTPLISGNPEPVSTEPLPAKAQVQELETSESSAGQLAVTSPDENLAMAYSADPYGLLPPWLMEMGFEMSWKLPPASGHAMESVSQNQESALPNPGPSAPEPAVTSVSEPESRASGIAEPARETEVEPLQTHTEAPADSSAQKPGQMPDSSGTRVSAATFAQPTPKNKAGAVAGNSATAETNQPAEIAVVSVPELAALLSQQPKTAASRGTPKPPLLSENNAAGQASGNLRKASEPKPPGALASFVAMQGNDLQRVPLQEPREPQGYITVESKPESLRRAAARTRLPKPAERRPKIEADQGGPQDNPPNSQDYPPKGGVSPAKPSDESDDLQRFASDFVRTDQTGSVPDQHRFYADSVHFFGEGDLSWAGVAAATRRYHQEKQNRRYEPAARAVIKGPVNGGFYLVDQPVAWSQTDGTRLTRGRSMLRLRVVPTGRGGWKITSIEEAGP
jgi:hypothetical protein